MVATTTLAWRGVAWPDNAVINIDRRRCRCQKTAGLEPEPDSMADVKKLMQLSRHGRIRGRKAKPQRARRNTLARERSRNFGEGCVHVCAEAVHLPVPIA